MHRTARRVVAATCCILSIAAPGTVVAEAPARQTPSVGARTLGDPLLPQLGNGGYDVGHYTIELSYDPATNSFGRARTTITAIARQRLDEFSLDFQDDLTVTAVLVNGRPATFANVEATPDLSPDPEVGQPGKLVITPDIKGRPKANKPFDVVIDYAGTPQAFIDPDGSLDGWIPSCYPLSGPQTCDGAFVVNEPIGVQTWFPSNNHPSDKATYDTLLRVPDASTAIGVGELVARTSNGDGTTTWHWTEDDPTATYLTTATVGNFLFTETSMVESSTGRTLPVYNFIDAAATPAQQTAINTSLARAAAQIEFLSGVFGPYPFDSAGAVADKVAGVGYALEVQTKPHYAGSFASGNPSINVGTQLHEHLHQWMGNSVSPAQWDDIWFNEAWAEWATWYWGFTANGGQDPAVLADGIHAAPDDEWALAPAVLDGDPANLFAGFAVYDRGAAMIQQYREIVGDPAFLAFVRTLTTQYAHANISTKQFVTAAVAGSGLRGSQRRLLEQFFQQWLYGTVRPTITSDSF